MSSHDHETNKEALATRYADLLSEQPDAEELQLIGDLETLYASTSVPEHLRLAPAFPGSMNGQQAQKQAVAPGTPPVSSPKQRIVTVRRRHWLNRLNALAAVLVAALLVGSLLVVTHIAQRSQQGNASNLANAPQCTIPQSHKSAAWLSYLHMTNLTTGWALGRDSINQSRVLHTTDGGTTWQDVTPVERGLTLTGFSQKTEYIGASYFLNGCSAWIVVIQPGNAPALLLRAIDGGVAWWQSTLLGHQIGGIDFIDAHVGWLTVDVLKNGKFGEEDFYHTLDGGLHWTKIAVSSPETNNQPGALPFANADGNLTFINANTGWITGALNVDNNPRLYITHDGGRTWHQQSLPPPDGDTRIFKSGTVVWPPQFFSATDGILPVSFWAADSVDAYVTHDGGNSWQSTSMLRIPMPPTIDVYAPTSDPDFVDVNHGWISGWQGTSLYATGDGGRHWTKFVPQLNVQYIALYNYDFVTSKIGWALGAITHSTLASVPPLLFKTVDGGKTWTYTGRG